MDILINWLLVEWETSKSRIVPQYGLINVRSLVNPIADLHTGKQVVVGNPKGLPKRAKIVMASDDRRFLEQQLITMKEHSRQIEAAAAACQVKISAQTAKQAQPKLQRMSAGPANSSSMQYSASNLVWNDANSHSDSDLEENNRQIAKKYIQERKSMDSSRNSKSMSTSVLRTPILIQRDLNVTRNSKNSQPPSRDSIVHSSRDNTPNSSRQYVKKEAVKRKPVNDDYVLRFDQGTQTDPCQTMTNVNPEMASVIEEKLSEIDRITQEFEEKISIMSAAIEILESKHTNCDGNSSGRSDDATLNEVNNLIPEDLIDEDLIEANMTNGNIIDDLIDEDQDQAFADNTIGENLTVGAAEDSETTPESFSGCELNDADGEMIPIGTGKTVVPRHILNQIDWKSYTMATRKLLMAIFPRRTLATHSLSGKPSPAFVNKPAKSILDPVKINDIVLTVKAKCGVKENLVRNAITIKCADENKLYRMRKERRQQQIDNSMSQNQENVPPLSAVIRGRVK